jgi:hypothetical protein
MEAAWVFIAFVFAILHAFFVVYVLVGEDECATSVRVQVQRAYSKLLGMCVRPATEGPRAHDS